ncbi:MAG: hypothetical protein KatS3mg105_0543 [Gemmatales bacterium]|nr:MAG: hypothetical protein KatS3mg105_0543 [Gemmatales bacterium]
MPLYEYTCSKCSHEFEALVFNGERVECPQCKAERVERRLSLPARPKTESSPLPLACDPKAPPCGPGCCRLP